MFEHIVHNLQSYLKQNMNRGLHSYNEDKQQLGRVKICQVDSFGKRNALRFDLKEFREGFFQRGRERSFHVEGAKTEIV